MSITSWHKFVQCVPLPQPSVNSWHLNFEHLISIVGLKILNSRHKYLLVLAGGVVSVFPTSIQLSEGACSNRDQLR